MAPLEFLAWLCSDALHNSEDARAGSHKCAWHVQALAAIPVGFLRIVGFVLYWLLSRIAATERAKARLWQRQIQKYGPIVSLPYLHVSSMPAADAPWLWQCELQDLVDYMTGLFYVQCSSFWCLLGQPLSSLFST